MEVEKGDFELQDCEKLKPHQRKLVKEIMSKLSPETRRHWVSHGKFGLYALLMQNENEESFLLLEACSEIQQVIWAKIGCWYCRGFDKEDMLNRILESLWIAAKGFNPARGTSFFTYFRGIITNKMINQVRESNRLKRTSKEGEIISSKIVEELSRGYCETEECSLFELENELSSIVHESHAPLLTSFEKRAIVLLACGYTYKEIAEMLETTFKAVDNAISRARKKIRGLKNVSCP